MNMRVTRRLEMLVRVRDFGAAHRALFPASTLGGKMFAIVGSAVTVLSQQAASEDARLLAKAFIAHDMPANFLTELNADLQEFEQAIREHAVGKDTHVAARAGIDTSMEEGLTAVQRLDAIVANRLRDDPTTVAVWDSVRHVERPARTRNDAPTPDPLLPPAPATASAAKEGSVPG